MNNYPLFVNLLTTFAYLPVSLAYVLPVQHTRPDIITPEARAVPQKVWAIMGGLDSIAGIMQSLSTAKLSKSGALIVLLTQAAIPFSMVITKVFLKAKYRMSQYVGAAAVIAGILIVLLPGLIDGSSSGSSTGIWAAVLVLSCIPMCLSSVYKEKALGDREIDPVYLNYWVAVYQLIIAFPLLIPTGLAVDVSPAEVPSNLLAGLKCYVGVNTVVGGSQPDNCSQGPIFVNFYM
jgi:drug/metabolite transporter (DMT)-like permease